MYSNEYTAVIYHDVMTEEVTERRFKYHFEAIQFADNIGRRFIAFRHSNENETEAKKVKNTLNLYEKGRED